MASSASTRRSTEAGISSPHERSDMRADYFDSTICMPGCRFPHPGYFMRHTKREPNAAQDRNHCRAHGGRCDCGSCRRRGLRVRAVSSQFWATTREDMEPAARALLASDPDLIVTQEFMVYAVRSLKTAKPV